MPENRYNPRCKDYQPYRPSPEKIREETAKLRAKHLAKRRGEIGHPDTLRRQRERGYD